MPRRFRRKAKKYFSTKGFKIVDKEKYAISHASTAKVPCGHSSGLTFQGKFLRSHLTATDNEWVAILDGTTGQHVYGRLCCRLSDFTTSGIMSYFNKFKIKRVSMTFRFPDQEASTTNSQHPVKFFVNYGDVHRAAWNQTGNVGYTAAQTSNPNEFLERPGWKEYDVKRMNQLTISFTPYYASTDEVMANYIGSSDDLPHMKKTKYFPANVSSNLTLYGPTICIRAPTPAGGYASPTVSPTAAGVLTTSTFLDFTTCDVTAIIAFKDRNEDADN